MTTPVAHPLVSAYLRDLELLLHGVEPGERAEVLGGVREHLDASLVPGATDDDVRAVLAELGSPHSVADEAYAGRPAPALFAPSRPRPSPWLAHVACFINGVGLALLTLVVVLGVVRPGPMTPHPSEWVVMGMGFVIPWSSLMVLTSMTAVWGSADRFRSILLYPLTFVALAVASLTAIPVASPVAATLVIAAAVWVLVRLIRATRT